MPLDFNQYSTAKPLLSGFPAWIADELEQLRITSYQLYEQMYWNVAETFKLVQRGEDEQPIYVPAPKVIVETLHRYLANGLQVIADPAYGDDQQKLLATQVWADLAKRERFYSRFNANKRYGIMRGDWVWHLYADPAKEAGSRISILPLDPGGLFPIYNEENLDEIIGWHIVEQFIDDAGKPRIRRLTYRKTTMKGGPSPITVEDAIFEIDKWGGPNMEDEVTVQVIRPPSTLPSPIDQLPIYNIPHFVEPGALWGSSELRGMERILAAVDQSISDEELTLAMDGLGVYATNAGAPIDPDTGEETDWGIGPARVVEVPESAFFNRVSGVSSVQPYQDHLKYLHEQIDLAASTPAVAKGKVDVTTAESGVALLIEFGPILATAMEKEQIATDVLSNMLYDLSKWYIAYEGTAFNSLLEITRWAPTYGPKIPENIQKKTDTYIQMGEKKILPLPVVWDGLRKLGYELPPNDELVAMMLEQAAAQAGAEADAMAVRLGGEIEAGGPPPDETENL